MFEIDGKVFRNIQEQVQKNKSDIEAFRNVESILNEFGITVLGKVDEESDIPSGTYNYGDAYLVGTETPYDMYIYTRTDIPGEGEFINIGPVSVVGPQGPQGEVGPAPTLEIGTVTTGNAGTDASATISGSDGSYTLNFTIPKGDKGDTGATGAQGIQGIQGEQGPQGIQGLQGDPGQSFMIMGTITNTSQLPDPSLTPRNQAYVLSDGNPSTADSLYYITGAIGSEVWTESSFACAGTTVTIAGSPVSTWSADTKIDEPTVSGTSGQVLSLDNSLNPIWKTVSGGIVTETKTFTSKTELGNYMISNAHKILAIRLHTTADIAFNAVLVKQNANDFTQAPTVSGGNAVVVLPSSADITFMRAVSNETPVNNASWYGESYYQHSNLELYIGGTTTFYIYASRVYPYDYQSNYWIEILSRQLTDMSSHFNKLTFTFYLNEPSV